ncbi:DEAD/DEAH box helicase [Thermodesulfobacteriota bacterium]
MPVLKIINKFRDKISKMTRKVTKEEEQPTQEAGDVVQDKGQPSFTPSEPKKTGSRKKRRPSRSSRPRRIEPVPSAEPILWDESKFQVPPQEGKTRFHDLNLPNEIMHAISETGFQYCTPIQAEILAGTLSGKDALGRAQTGTGKTAAFLLTIFLHLLKNDPPSGKKQGRPRALILAPTRELVLQIVEDAKVLGKYCSVNIVAILGGIDYAAQQKKLTEGKVDIVVATPGRLLHFQRQQAIHLNKVEILVIDEADRMLDMGFIPDVRTIVYSTPHKEKRQTLLFSATLTHEVTNLSSQWTTNPLVVEIEPEHVVTETVKQLVYLVTANRKIALLYNIITMQKLDRVLVFCNRRDQTNLLADKLKRYGINCAVLSGEVPQHKRLKRLENFRSGKIRVLVATDVAGRGIHIEKISHVINYSLPYEPEDYVHRIGRTGRAGTEGISVSFADENDSFYIPDIEEFIGEKLHCIEPEEGWLKMPPTVAPASKPHPPRRRTGPQIKRKPRSSNPRRSTRNP